MDYIFVDYDMCIYSRQRTVLSVGPVFLLKLGARSRNPFLTPLAYYQ